MARHQPRIAAQRFQGVLQGQAVHHRGQHAHVMGRGLVNAGVAGGELGPAEDIAAADDQCQLDAVLGRLAGLPGDVDHGVHGDAPLAGMREALAGDLQHNPAETPAARTPAGRITAGRNLAGRTTARLRHGDYSLGSSQSTKPLIFMPAALANSAIVLPSYLAWLAWGCSSRQRSA